LDIKRIKRDVVFRGGVIDLLVDEVEYPSGNRSLREIVHHPGGGVAVPLFDDGRVMLVRQLRSPFGTHVLELPAGKLGPGEDPRDCAARELEEETGWVAARWEKLCSIYTSPGFCDEVLHLFLATGLKESPHGHARGEGEAGMTLHTMLLSEALQLIEYGEIHDAKSICGLQLVSQRMRGTR
jgi:ADP-ribose pyrophosphatase